MVNKMSTSFVKDIMRNSVISIDESMTVKDAAQIMTDTKVGCVIITKEIAPVGILTERDFVTKIISNQMPYSTVLSEVMSSPLVSISADETVWEAAETMKTKKIHKLPVVDENKMVGIITATDLVKVSSVGSDSNMRQIADQILIRMRNDKYCR